MRSRFVTVVALTLVAPACGFHATAVNGSPGDAGDAGAAEAMVPMDSSVGLDAPQDSSVTDAPQLCFGTGVVQVCLAQLPTAQLTVSSNQAIVTDVGSSSCVATTNPAAAGYCVVAATAIQIDNNRTLRGTGARPLVLVSTSTFSLSGTIDVASHPTSPGAGGNSTACVAGTAGGVTGGSGGGGCGGSFGGKGSNGETNGGSGGVASPAVVPDVLRGGCPGSKGGNQGPLGNGGDGGGAVALIAVTMMTISGTINASGSGGQCGNIQHAGAPGGGSGGMIVLDGAQIDVAGAGRLFANGGGGGEGNSTGGQGRDGNDPVSSTAAATGGAGGSNGGDGGAGSLGGDGSAPPGNAANQDGGGGGGGGAGVIKSNKALGGIVSPAPS